MMVYARQGQIVNCNFPLVELPNTPGDSRPALVLKVADEEGTGRVWALVAYASGQGGTAANKSLRAHQMELDPTTENGLVCPTVISLARVVWLPLTDEWFPTLGNVKDG